MPQSSERGGPPRRVRGRVWCYTRIARSVQETWEREPDWLQLLRAKLSGALETRSERFGTPIEEGRLDAGTYRT
jgi:hypothetical protein